MDEYDLLYAWLAGMVAQAVRLDRSRRGLITTGLVLAASLGLAYLLTESGDDRAFGLPVLGGLAFGVVTAIVGRERLLPVVSPRSIAHLSLVFYYSVAVLGGGRVPGWLWAITAIPGAAVLACAALGPPWGRNVRLGFYLWFLALMLWLIPGQVSVDHLKALEIQYGFSWQIWVYSFSLGCLTLPLLGYGVHLFLALPLPRRRDRLWRLLGEREDPADAHTRRHRAGLADKVRGAAFGWRPVLLLLVHAAALTANLLTAVLSSVVVINISVVALSWGWYRRSEGSLNSADQVADINLEGSQEGKPRPEQEMEAS